MNLANKAQYVCKRLTPEIFLGSIFFLALAVFLSCDFLCYPTPENFKIVRDGGGGVF
jgi:hypothetical protein